MARILIFEDEGYKKLLPLTYTRPVWDLRCGIITLKEKILRAYSGVKADFYGRDYLVEKPRLSSSGYLLLNGRLLNFKPMPLQGPDEIFISDDQIVAARVSKLEGLPVKELFAKLKRKVKITRIKAKLICHLWDLVHENKNAIESDFKALAGNKKQYIGEGTVIKPGAVLDAEEGPIYIGEKVIIQPNAVIIGPVYIGDRSIIKAGAKIFGGTSIGEGCKVGGEVEGSIIHSYSNKQHDGFLGHSYLGSWVNLGAGTSNSDLKNNYGPVKVYEDGKPVDSEQMFAGLFMGDHSKSGINTMFNTGTVVGVSSNVFGAGFQPKFIPSFSWGGVNKFEVYEFKKALEVARIVMSRRGKKLTGKDEAILKEVYRLTRT